MRMFRIFCCTQTNYKNYGEKPHSILVNCPLVPKFPQNEQVKLDSLESALVCHNLLALHVCWGCVDYRDPHLLNMGTRS